LACCWIPPGTAGRYDIAQPPSQFERQNQVTERVIANGVQVTSALGERGVELHQAVVRFKDGRVGGACVDLGSWFLEGIVGGVYDGLDAAAHSQRKAS